MISEEEKQEIIEKASEIAMEKALLKLPHVMSVLLQEKVMMRKLADEFFKTNPDFNNHKDIVASVIQEVEGKNPGKQYSEVLKISEPKIKERISQVSKLDMQGVSRPTSLKVENFKGIVSDNGEL